MSVIFKCFDCFYTFFIIVLNDSQAYPQVYELYGAARGLSDMFVGVQLSGVKYTGIELVWPECFLNFGETQSLS